MIGNAELATHRGKRTGLLYKKNMLSNRQYTWLVYHEDHITEGWAHTPSPIEPLILLTPRSLENNSNVRESFDNIKELCKDTDLDITVYSDGINVFDGTSETQGYMSVENIIRLSEIKKEYLKLIEDFN